ncbi:Uncharacterised protein [Mycobacteroides abscessus]|nr:Uncharacterised protein [Mycobacteroides abscessus]
MSPGASTFTASLMWSSSMRSPCSSIHAGTSRPASAAQPTSSSNVT